MNAKHFMHLLNTLPDDMIESAVTYRRSRRKKLFVLLPPIAACFTIATTAVIYPKLKNDPPEIKEVTTTSSVTTQIGSDDEPTTVVTVSAESYLTSLILTDAKTTRTTASVTVQTTSAETKKTTAGTNSTQTDPKVTPQTTAGTAAPVTGTTGHHAQTQSALTTNRTHVATTATVRTTQPTTAAFTEHTTRTHIVTDALSEDTKVNTSTRQTTHHATPVTTTKEILPCDPRITGIAWVTEPPIGSWAQTEFGPVTTKSMPLTTEDYCIVTTSTDTTTSCTTTTRYIDPSAETALYNVIPHGLDYQKAESANTFNRVKVKPGEIITVDWIVDYDPGTAGMQIAIDFGQLNVLGTKEGRAYEKSRPSLIEFSKYYFESGCIYRLLYNTVQTCKVSTPIYSFTIRVPETPGTYPISLGKSRLENKVYNWTDVITYYHIDFRGLELIVEEEAAETPLPIDTSKTVVYSLIPRNMPYQKAESAGDYNRVTVKPDQGFKIDWLVDQDPGTAGIQIALNFGSTYLDDGSKPGGAYISPQYFMNDWHYNNGQTQFVYLWEKDSKYKVDTTKPVFTFRVYSRSEGIYRIDIDRNEVNKVIPDDGGAPYNIDFRGLEIIVTDPSAETTTVTQHAGTYPYTYTYTTNPEWDDRPIFTTGTTARWPEESDPDWYPHTTDPEWFLRENYATGTTVHAGTYPYSYIYTTDPEWDDRPIFTTGTTARWPEESDPDWYPHTTDPYWYEPRETFSGTTGTWPDDPETYTYTTSTTILEYTDIDDTYETTTTQKLSGKTICYNLVPRDLEYEAAASEGENNRVYVSPGQTVTVDWMVDYDPGTAGMQICFDFSQVQLRRTERGSAYGGAFGVLPFEQGDVTTDPGLHIYQFWENKPQRCNNTKPIYSFTVTVPETPGNYQIRLHTGTFLNIAYEWGTTEYDDDGDVIGIDANDAHHHIIDFRGLEFIVHEP